MAYRVRLSSAERLAVVELTGTVRWADLAAVLHALYGHPAWAPGFDALWDGSALTSVDVAPENLPEIRETIARYTPVRADGRSAVVTRSDTDATLAVLFSRFGPRTGREIRVFREAADALAFLGREAVPEDLPVIASSDP